MYGIGSVFRVTIFGLFGGVVKMSNVYQFYLAAGATPFTFAEIVDELAEVVTEICTAIAALQWDGFEWTSYSVATLDADEVSGEIGLIAPIAGSNEGDPLPSQTTIQIRWATGHSRRILKKAYMGTVESGTLAANGNYAGGVITAWSAIGALLLETFEASNSAWLYCYSSTAPVEPGSLVFPRSGVVSSIPKVQRRRRYSS